MEPIWKVINHTTWRARFDDMIRRDGNRMTPSLVRQVAMATEWTGADYQRAMFQRTDLFRMVQQLVRDGRLSGDADAVAHRAADRPGPVRADPDRRRRGRRAAPQLVPLHHAVQHHRPPGDHACAAASTRDGLPIGLQIVGRFRDEASVLRAAAIYEASEDWLDAMARPVKARGTARPSLRGAQTARARLMT